MDGGDDETSAYFAAGVRSTLVSLPYCVLFRRVEGQVETTGLGSELFGRRPVGRSGGRLDEWRELRSTLGELVVSRHDGQTSGRQDGMGQCSAVCRRRR
jgi:hypothetical protein